MSEKRFVPGKIFRPGEVEHESLNIDYNTGDFVVLNDLGKQKIGDLGIKGKVIQIIKQLNQRSTTRVETANGMVEYQSNFFSKVFAPGKIKKIE